MNATHLTIFKLALLLLLALFEDIALQNVMLVTDFLEDYYYYGNCRG